MGWSCGDNLPGVSEARCACLLPYVGVACCFFGSVARGCGVDFVEVCGDVDEERSAWAPEWVASCAFWADLVCLVEVSDAESDFGDEGVVEGGHDEWDDSEALWVIAVGCDGSRCDLDYFVVEFVFPLEDPGVAEG